MGFHGVYHLVDDPQKSWTVRGHKIHSRWLAHPDNKQVALGSDDVKTAATILDALASKDDCPALASALKMLLQAMAAPTWEERYMLRWIAIEALFGPSNSHGEIVYRLSQRAALFLTDGGSEAHNREAQIRAAYKWRSKVVHGLHLEKLHSDKSLELLQTTELLLQEGMRRILLDSTLRAKFSKEKDRESFLDGLPFRN